MRVSIDKSDQGHSQYMAAKANGQDVFIFLDGIEQKHVITADDETGLVVRDVLDADGQPQIDPKSPDRIWIEEVTGTVRIEFRKQS